MEEPEPTLIHSQEDSQDEEEGKDENNDVYDVVIIGGGVVGLAILRQAMIQHRHQGYKCCLLEKEPHVLHWASGSNSGIVCTGIDIAEKDSLERALIRNSLPLIPDFCHALNVPYNPCGSLVCRFRSFSTHINHHCDALETHCDALENHDALQKFVDASVALGDAHACLLTREQVLTMEPFLNPHDLHETATAAAAAFIPGEIIVEPWLFGIALACHARENGATILCNFEVDCVQDKGSSSSFSSSSSSSWNADTQLWTLVQQKQRTPDGGVKRKRKRVHGRVVVNCTGAWSDQVQHGLMGHCPWTIRPRRGQYVVLDGRLPSPSSSSSSPLSSTMVVSRPIQPIPTTHSKGIFVFPSIYAPLLVIGPTATDQTSRDDRTLDATVRNALLREAQRRIPSLSSLILSPTSSNHNTDSRCILGEYVGIRPAVAQFRDYQISFSHDHNWITCAGIRSTGLTASLGIGMYVVDALQRMLQLQPQPPPKQPLHILPISTTISTTTTTTTPLPSLDCLVKNFRRRGDGTVEIRGHIYTVTHPLTQMGWQHYTLQDE